MSTPEPKEQSNTEAQLAYHEAQEAAWEEQKTWPVFKVVITGDEVEWEPRNDERYWEQNEAGEWVSKSGSPVIMTARGTVICQARNEEMAKMMALRDNPEYHTVESVEEVEV